MAKTGYITSSGIQQVFTNGPYSGSLVTSSYASGSTFFGPTVDFKQSFTSGTLDYLFPCAGLSYYRYYEDLINCPINNCSPPVLTNATPTSCEFYDNEYIVSYNSSSATAVYTVVEYSTSETFIRSGSVIYTNSISPQLPIDTSTLSRPPTAYTTVYFRAYNSCSSGATSSYSNIASASCSAPIDDGLGTIIQPFSIEIINDSGTTLYYRRSGGIQYALLNNASTIFDFTGGTYNLDFSTLGFPNREEYYNNTLFANIRSFFIQNGDVSITLTDLTGTNNIENTSTFPYTFAFEPDGYRVSPDLNVDIDKTSYPYGGTLSFTITDNPY